MRSWLIRLLRRMAGAQQVWVGDQPRTNPFALYGGTIPVNEPTIFAHKAESDIPHGSGDYSVLNNRYQPMPHLNADAQDTYNGDTYTGKHRKTNDQLPLWEQDF